ncbi:MAG: hypothetical protein M3132_01265 [Actinomycetia bacterium]|nr:hypothetical protein [Actinomycetes bacterium]
MPEILINRDSEGWRAPSRQTVTDEAELQRILTSSPELLPGPEEIPLLAAAEFPVISGRVDIVAVAADGTIIVVECKLRANPEIRRQVLGQVLAYASALWQMPFEQFESSFHHRSGQSLFSLDEQVDDSLWDADEFRRSVSSNLQSGTFRVVVAVDEITDELKRTIAYLNGHTTNTLEIVALELGYMRDGDIEILVPTVYGEETAATKREARTRRWTEQQFWQHASEVSSDESLTAIKTMHEWAVRHESSLYWGDGKKHPSMTAWAPFGDSDAPIWSCYLADDDETVIGMNFGWLTKRATPDQLQRLADDLGSIPDAARLLGDIETSEFTRRPSLPIAAIIPDDAMSAFLGAFDSLLSD